MLNKEVEGVLVDLMRVLDTPKARDIALTFLSGHIDYPEWNPSRNADDTCHYATLREVCFDVDIVETYLADYAAKGVDASELWLGDGGLTNLVRLTGSRPRADMAVKAIRAFGNADFHFKGRLSNYELENIGDFREPLKAIAAAIRPDEWKEAK